MLEKKIIIKNICMERKGKSNIGEIKINNERRMKE
jgi:hypothetical protein